MTNFTSMELNINREVYVTYVLVTLKTLTPCTLFPFENKFIAVVLTEADINTSSINTFFNTKQ